MPTASARLAIRVSRAGEIVRGMANVNILFHRAKSPFRPLTVHARLSLLRLLPPDQNDIQKLVQVTLSFEKKTFDESPDQVSRYDPCIS